jgi:hypothetical protein
MSRSQPDEQRCHDGCGTPAKHGHRWFLSQVLSLGDLLCIFGGIGVLILAALMDRFIF